MTRRNGCTLILAVAALGCSGGDGGAVPDAGYALDVTAVDDAPGLDAPGLDAHDAPSPDAPAPSDAPPTADLGPANASCVGGTTRCGARCVSLDSDNQHCGACDAACAAGERCEGGRCALTCPAGSSMCRPDGGAPRCVNLQRDGENCGACGVACAQGTVCMAGACAASCGAGLTACAASCRDTRVDPRNCGACGTACAAGQLCQSGQCQCPAGQVQCVVAGAPRCVDTRVDSSHCGACGAACAGGTRCVMGRCEASCPTGQFACADGCVDTSTSLSHCGTCGRVCATTPNRPVFCRDGNCAQGECNAPYADCDTDFLNGCEVNLRSNPEHCGRCGRSCGAPNFARAECSEGACVPLCDPGHGNCDGNPLNGCEVDLQYDPRHCGGCGRACGAGQGCRRGQCVSTTGALLCSTQAALTCLSAGGRTPTNAQDGKIVCVFGNVSTTDFCGQSCGSYRLFVWRDGAGLPACATAHPAPTRRGTTYTAPVTCGCDQPLRNCGSFDLGECVGD